MRIVVRIVAGVALLLAGLTAFDYFAPYTSARMGLALEQRRAGLEEATARIPGFEMPYLHGGAGEPLLLVHGFGADKNNFTRVARLLTPHYRVVIPDLPGFGEASKPADASYAIADQVERLRQFAQGLGLKRVHLGGSSMGGFIATLWAAKYPHEVASLWLLAPGGTAAEMRQVMKNLEVVLRNAGVMFAQVTMARIFLVDFKTDYPVVNKIYAEYFAAGRYPARTTVGVPGLALGCRVEVDLIAKL